jgi:chromosome segregation ATPase
MSVDWSQIEQSFVLLHTQDSFDVQGVKAKQDEIMLLIREMKSMFEEPNEVLEGIISNIEELSKEYVVQMLNQMDSAQGLLESVAYTKATIKKDESLKKTLALELLQLQVINRNLEDDCRKKREVRDSALHHKAQLAQELEFEVANIERYRDAQKETKEKLFVLEDEAKELRTENAKLQTKLKHLEENIEGMKRLKEEHMLSIMQNTEMLSKISSGTE